MKLKIYNKPCLNEDNKIMANAFIGEKIDLERFEAETKDSGLTEPKLSKSLGVLNLKHKGKTIMIFDSGKISIRTADNEKDIIEATDIIIKILEKIK
ncbi:MAG: hypothetical protein ABIH52_02295 [Candidatus Aenigmatarchaeota archaeon]|nr:hypothetical protein [Nanoarchaeota archaeon]